MWQGHREWLVFIKKAPLSTAASAGATNVQPIPAAQTHVSAVLTTTKKGGNLTKIGKEKSKMATSRPILVAYVFAYLSKSTTGLSSWVRLFGHGLQTRHAAISAWQRASLFSLSQRGRCDNKNHSETKHKDEPEETQLGEYQGVLVQQRHLIGQLLFKFCFVSFSVPV